MLGFLSGLLMKWWGIFDFHVLTDLSQKIFRNWGCNPRTTSQSSVLPKKNNENLSRTFLRKLHSFIGVSFKVFVMWNTNKIRGLFPLKDGKLHPNCVIYEGNVFTSGATNIKM